MARQSFSSLLFAAYVSLSEEVLGFLASEASLGSSDRKNSGGNGT